MLLAEQLSFPYMHLLQEDLYSLLASNQNSFIFIKDMLSHYKYANPLFLEIMGCKSLKEISNQTDEMLCRDSKKVKIYKNMDAEVLEEEKILYVKEEVVPKRNALITKQMEGTIYPLFGEGSKPIAVLGGVQPCSLPFKLSLEIAVGLTIEEMNVHFKRLYQVQVHERCVNLSKRELQCIIELIKGKTAGEIATALQLKQTTIEFYIDNVKNKLGATNKSSLLSTVFSQKIIQQVVL